MPHPDPPPARDLRAPSLTVVVLVGDLRERAGPCLRSVLAQDPGGEMEILVYDLGAPGAPPIPGTDDPRVSVLATAPGSTFAEVRAAAAVTARAPVVAYVEEHVRVRPGWARALLAAYEEGVVAVGAVVHTANPGRGRSEVIGVMSYGLFHPPVPRGDMTMLPGHNCSYRRDALLALGADLGPLLQCDIQLQKRLARQGGRLILEPAAEIDHLTEPTYRSIARGVHLWHRCYGPLRAWDEGWGPARRALYVLATPLLPAWFLVRFPRLLARTGRGHLAAVLRRHLAGLYMVQLAAAAGQALGLLIGPGRAPVRFTSYELHEPRPE